MVQVGSGGIGIDRRSTRWRSMVVWCIRSGIIHRTAAGDIVEMKAKDQRCKRHADENPRAWVEGKELLRGVRTVAQEASANESPGKIVWQRRIEGLRRFARSQHRGVGWRPAKSTAAALARRAAAVNRDVYSYQHSILDGLR